MTVGHHLRVTLTTCSPGRVVCVCLCMGEYCVYEHVCIWVGDLVRMCMCSVRGCVLVCVCV